MLQSAWRDAPDMLTICVDAWMRGCVDAWMPIEAAMRRAAQEQDMLRVNTSVASELRLTARDMSLMPDRPIPCCYQTRAAQLPVYLTLPMILFIMPVIFIVVIGPVALSLPGQ